MQGWPLTLIYMQGCNRLEWQGSKLVKLDEADGDVIGQVARMTHIAGGEKRVKGKP